MLRDAVHLGINPYGPDKGWTLGGPIDLGTRRKTLHPSPYFGVAIGDFPLRIRWGGLLGSVSPGRSRELLPGAMDSTLPEGGPTPALPLTRFGHVGT